MTNEIQMNKMSSRSKYLQYKIRKLEKNKYNDYDEWLFKIVSQCKEITCMKYLKRIAHNFKF